jgi:hypothetical protein
MRPTGKAWLACALALLPVAMPPSRAQPQGQGGISFEEYRRVFPPPPAAVRAKRRDGTVTLSWEKPASANPSGQLAYDPVVVRYRVYRLGPGHEMTLIGETRGTSLAIAAPPPGTTGRYVVTAVQRSGHESAPSPEAVVRVP